jgi:hypothetical protein
MTDERRNDWRDRLPDLAHDTVGPAERAALDAALAGDADLRAEFAAVQAARHALTPRVGAPDVGRIVAALPPAPGRGVADVTPIRSARSARRAPLSAWRIAAAVTVLVVGAAALSVARRAAERTPVAPVAVVPTPSPTPSPDGDPPTAPSAPPTGVEPTQLALAPAVAGQADLSDLTDAELESLIAALDDLTGELDPEPEERAIVGSAARVTLPDGGGR